jgi:molecular chaperone DnaK (HSP70)
MSVVGIDLGTTNTVVASMRDGRVQVLVDAQVELTQTLDRAITHP